MIQELKLAVQGIVDVGVHARTDVRFEGDDTEEATVESLTEQSADVRRLLKSVEDVLHHQIKPPLFGQVPKVWKYLENLDKCMPGTTEMLQSSKLICMIFGLDP